MSNLEKVYYNLHILDDNYADGEDVKSAREDIINFYSGDDKLKYEELIIAHALANEKQGFMFGFQYAVSLLMNGKDGVTA